MLLVLNNKIKTLKPIFISQVSNKNTIYFLRKTRLFVKSRYSRNRQWSKSIVYFGLWFNIMSVIWTTYYCYRYMFIFSYLYWIGAVFVLITALRIAKFISLDQLLVFCTNFSYQF